MILVDTSAWVEFDRATGSAVDRRLTEEISRGGHELAVSEPVLMEVLAGTRSERHHRDVLALLTSYAWCPVDPTADFEQAATVYRRCRSVGITPRGLLDCLIAAVAIRNDVAVLTADRDFARVAEVVPLQLVPASAP